jgi:hypothetical protein
LWCFPGHGISPQGACGISPFMGNSLKELAGFFMLKWIIV